MLMRAGVRYDPREELYSSSTEVVQMTCSPALGYTLAAVLCMAIAGCATVQTTRPGAVGIERKQTMLVSEESVEQGAGRAYDHGTTECARRRQTQLRSGAHHASATRRRKTHSRDHSLPSGCTELEVGGQYAHHTRDERVRHARRQDHGVQRAGGEAAVKRCGTRRGSRARDLACSARAHARTGFQSIRAERIALAGLAVVTGMRCRRDGPGQ